MSHNTGRHHQRRKSHGMSRWLRHHRKTAICGAVLVIGLVFACAGYLVMQKQGNRHITAGNSVNMGSGYRELTYNGKKYQYNTLVTAILYAGLDSEGEIGPGTYTDAPRADSISLVVLDEKNKKMSVLSFDRDTMATMHRYTVNGRDRGTYEGHLCLAYTYGDGGKVSCENLREAVSELMGGVPIQEYVVTNRSSLPYLNQLVGGVTVEVPNDDLAEEYPDFYQGAVVTIEDDMVENYLRKRDIEKNFTNEGRLERQRTYIESYIQQFMERAQGNTRDLWDQIARMDTYIQTSITRNKYLDMADALNRVEFGQDNYWIVEGERVAGELHDEFYVDRESLKEKVIELFYEEQ